MDGRNGCCGGSGINDSGGCGKGSGGGSGAFFFGVSVSVGGDHFFFISGSDCRDMRRNCGVGGFRGCDA